MKNNKVLMSLVAASIAAMAVAPELLKNETSDGESKKSIIDLSKQFKNQETADVEFVEAVNNQMSSILSKKTPIMKVSESVSVLVDNYGTLEQSIKQQIYAELNLAQTPNQDSTSVLGGGPFSGTVAGSGGQAAGSAVNCHAACHGACHGACHSACHGSRGWR